MLNCLLVLVLLNPVANLPASNSPSISGAVKLPNGEPAIGAKVYLVEKPERHFTLPVKTIIVHTDLKGTYAYENVKPGKYLVWAEWKSLTTLQKRLGGQKVEVADASVTVSSDLLLHEGCTYAVRVLDASTKEPIAKAKVSFAWTDIVRSYSTDDLGFVEIAGLAENEWYFVVEEETHAVYDHKIGVQPLGSRTELTFELNRGAILSGTIVDEAGAPVSRAKIHAGHSQVAMRPSIGSAVTDEKGHFSINSLPTLEALEIRLAADNFQSKTAQLTIQDHVKKEEAEFEMKATVTRGDCIVTVTDPQGKPLGGAVIVNYGEGNKQKEVMTDATGLARVNQLYSSSDFANPQGEVQLRVHAAGFLDTWVSVASKGDAALANVSVRLQKGVTFQGRVVNSKGEPIPKVQVSSLDSQPQIVDTDSEGRFELTNRRAGSQITLQPRPPYAPKYDLSWNSNVKGKEIELDYEGVIRVVAIDKVTGKRLPSFNVKVMKSQASQPNDPVSHIHPHQSDPGTSIVSPSAEFRLGSLQVGTPLKIVVSAKGFESKALERAEAMLEKEIKLIEVQLSAEE